MPIGKMGHAFGKAMRETKGLYSGIGSWLAKGNIMAAGRDVAKYMRGDTGASALGRMMGGTSMAYGAYAGGNVTNRMLLGRNSLLRDNRGRFNIMGLPGI